MSKSAEELADEILKFDERILKRPCGEWSALDVEAVILLARYSTYLAWEVSTKTPAYQE